MQDNIILVTGANGFIGRYTAKAYHEKGYIVIGMGHGKWIKDDYKKWGIDIWYESDITIENLLKKVKGISGIVHCAGSGSVGFSIENPMLDFERTVWTTHYILEYIRRYSPTTRLIYPSSAAVYGNLEYVSLKENSTLNPISPYGYHKKIVEEICKMYVEQYGLSIVITRLFSVYGNNLKKQLLWDACKKLDKGIFTFWGTGEETRDWIHVKDVARFFVNIFENNNIKFDTINIASGKDVKIKSILEYLFNEYGVSEKPIFGGEINNGNPAHYLADIKKMKSYNLITEISLEKGIREYVRWYKNYEQN